MTGDSESSTSCKQKVAIATTIAHRVFYYTSCTLERLCSSRGFELLTPDFASSAATNQKPARGVPKLSCTTFSACFALTCASLPPQIEHASRLDHSNVVGLQICGDPAREWGDNCPPRVALFTAEEVRPGFRPRWAKCDSGFDGNESPGLSDASQGGGQRSGSASEEADDDDVVMTEAGASEAGQAVSQGQC